MERNVDSKGLAHKASKGHRTLSGTGPFISCSGKESDPALSPSLNFE